MRQTGGIHKVKEIIVSLVLVAVICLPGYAGDMRLDHMAREQAEKAFLEKARQDLAQAKERALEQEALIKMDRDALKNAVSKMKKANAIMDASNSAMETATAQLRDRESSLLKELSATMAINKELSGFIRESAKDIESLVVQSQTNGLAASRTDFLEPLIHFDRFPSMDDIQAMGDLLLGEIESSGNVRMTRCMIVDRQGREQEADVLVIGNFSAVYFLGDETGFLLYSQESQRFFALSKLPSSHLTKTLNLYRRGKVDDVPLDVSKGGALRQYTHQLSFLEQIPNGGPIVWPIVAIMALAVLILLERILFLFRKTINADRFMNQLNPLIRNQQWDDCRRLLERHQGRLIPKVLLTALAVKDQSRQDMENTLQEAILGEIPRVERFLSTLGMLAAIAPLLGLLGTVTGMINTFHVITYFGTGDPRMMSGGISEALVTTMLGLSVAIPIMLAHTLLTRRVDNEISRMEEKAVSFVNLVFVERETRRKA